MQNNSEKYILIIGNYSSSNRGDAALMDGLIKLLNIKYPDHDLVISSFFPDVAEHFHKISSVEPIIKTRWRPMTTRLGEIIKIISLILLPISIFHLLTRNNYLSNIYKNASRIVMVGGGNLHAPYFNELWGRMAELLYCSRLNKKIYIVGQSLGPFGTGLLKQFCKYVLRKCTHIFPREEISKQRLLELGVTTPLTIIPDTAFALESADFNPDGISYIKTEGIDLNAADNIVTISLRQWTGDHRKNNQFQSDIALALDELVKKGYQILFIATCTKYGNYHNDDREIAFAVWRRMEMRNNTHILVDEYNPYEIASILKIARFHIGMRLHSCILAFDANTPCIAIEYESKTSGVMNQMGLSEYVLKFDSFSSKQLLSACERLESDYDNIKKQVAISTDNQRKTLNDSLLSSLE